MAWSKMLGVAELRAERPGLYAASLAGADSDGPAARCIAVDIGRTFPTVPLFHARGGIGQEALRRVLTAYAVCDPEVGYCQGMAFVAGVFLCYAPEEEAFLLLHAAMRRPSHQLRLMFLPGLGAVKASCRVVEALTRERAPRLAAHLESLSVVPEMWATSWLMTCFSTSTPFALTVRVWDCLAAEGFKPVLRTVMALLLRAGPRLRHCTMEQALMVMRGLHEASFDADMGDEAAGAGADAPVDPGTPAEDADGRRAKEAAEAAWRQGVLQPDALLRDAFALRLTRGHLRAVSEAAAAGVSVPL